MRVLRLFDADLITLIQYEAPPPRSGTSKAQSPPPASAIFNDGQVEATTECAMRVTGWTKYAAFVDIDDFLLVRTGNDSINLLTLLNGIDEDNERWYHSRGLPVLPVGRHTDVMNGKPFQSSYLVVKRILRLMFITLILSVQFPTEHARQRAGFYRRSATYVRGCTGHVDEYIRCEFRLSPPVDACWPTGEKG
jgi:hypothetical protein